MLARAACATAARCCSSVITPPDTRKCPSVSSRGVDDVLTGLPFTRSTVLVTRPRLSTSLPVARSSYRSSKTAGSGRIASSPDHTAMPDAMGSLGDGTGGPCAIGQHREPRQLTEARLRLALDRAWGMERPPGGRVDRARHVACQ